MLTHGWCPAVLVVRGRGRGGWLVELTASLPAGGRGGPPDLLPEQRLAQHVLRRPLQSLLPVELKISGGC